MALVSLGTETCGSVREPAAFTGLVGLKPTYGALSRYGIIAMGNSLDQVAPFGKTVADTEIIFNALSKHDGKDSTSVPDDLRNKIMPNAQNLKSKIIGVPWHLFREGVDERVMQNFKDSMEQLKKIGYEIRDIELPYSKYSLAAYYIIMPAEVSTNLSRFDGIRYGYHADGANLLEVYKNSRGQGFGREARRRILLGTYVLSYGYYDAYYTKAVKVRHLIEQEIKKAFQEVGLIATPTTPYPAFKLGEKLDDPVSMYLSDIFSAPANIAGVPSIALPSGETKEGLPLSIQFMAGHFNEEALFRAGKEFEKVMGVIQ
jgi:aspartyl-tRNA(Asn)/glutamyl-tRNA(Gln) amidotransferase subunit A